MANLSPWIKEIRKIGGNFGRKIGLKTTAHINANKSRPAEFRYLIIILIARVPYVKGSDKPIQKMKDINTSIKLPEPWHWTEHDLTSQLEGEISKTHILYGKKLRTLARRQDNDDVLFLIDNQKFAVVHLTWTSERYTDNRWPTTQLFDNWDQLFQKRILKDVEDLE